MDYYLKKQMEIKLLVKMMKQSVGENIILENPSDTG